MVPPVTAKQASTGADARLDATQPCSTPLNRESNTGPASALERVGASWSAVSGEESGVCGDSGESASALENAAESGACSNVAKSLTVVELVCLAQEALMALDAGEIDLAKELLRAFAAAARGASGERTGCG